ncbi:cupredoxin domain-containing protein [Psychrobacillus sp. L3]|uniref:cupredoxin domain-containing protein n=1 Tax=Psychrobacillus sp. L3 TaxID=3236891 RepID=UPI0036F432DE
MKKLFSLIILSMLVFALAACGSDKSSEDKATEDKATEEVAAPDESTVEPTGNVVEATVTAKNFEFDVKEIKAKVGDTVKITLVNDAGAHGIGIDEYNVDIKGGETAEFVVDKAGEYDYYCSLLCGVGHDKMAGKLIVE